MDKEINTAWNTLFEAGVLDYCDVVDLAHKYYDRHPNCTTTDVENLFGSSVEENVAFELMAYGKRHGTELIGRTVVYEDRRWKVVGYDPLRGQYVLWAIDESVTSRMDDVMLVLAKLIP